MDQSNSKLAFQSKSAVPDPTPGLVAGPGGVTGVAPANQIVTAEAILEVLRQGERFLICSHSRPDGDAVGSILAMGMLLKQLGKHTDIVTTDRIPKIHRELPGAEEIRIAQCVHGSYDAVIVLECDGLPRTGLLGLEQYFQINIDHHSTGRAYANLNWIDPHAPSVGALVYQLVKDAGAQVTPEMATCLYTTVLTDTGGFSYGSIAASTFGLAQELVQAGADPLRIAQKVYFSMPVSKMLLLGAALGNLKQEGKVAWLWVTRQDIARAGAAEENCEGIVNFALCVAGAEVAVFLYELPEERIQLSLRSKGRVNVASLALQLGGGGHKCAAGCTMEGPLMRAIDEILSHLRLSVAKVAGEADC